VDVSCPGLFGTKFKEAETMVELGRQPEASQEQQEDKRFAMERLGESTRQIILRRTSDVINKYLPPKTVNIVFCRPTPYRGEGVHQHGGEAAGQGGQPAWPPPVSHLQSEEGV
jgi:SNF2 family DNA or RNA helicase